MTVTDAISPPGFSSYLHRQRKMLLTATGISILSFVLLKVLYPYPDMFSDSTSYIYWAGGRIRVAFRPTGYSFFLYYLHEVWASPLLVAMVQYLLFFVSSMFCFTSVDYMFGLPAKYRMTILLCVLLNPMLLLQTNLISSDSVFSSLTVAFVTICLWLTRRKGWWALAVQLVVLYWAIETRYTALILPVVSVVTLLACSCKLYYKLTGIALTAALVFFCVQRQKDLTEEEQLGVRVFSGFSGWQIANNALYCYKHIDLDNSDLPSAQIKVIDKAVRKYIDSMGLRDGDVGSEFIWNKRSPLKYYCAANVKHLNIGYFNVWIGVSELYNDYGWYIIRHFPGAFTRYYLLPNTLQFFYPEKEALEDYNSSDMRLPVEATSWYELDTDRLESRTPGLQKAIISVFPALSLLLNVWIIAVVVMGIVKKKIGGVKPLFITWGVFYFVFMGFSIFAAAVNLRFLDPIFVTGIIISSALLHHYRTQGREETA